MDFSKTLHIAVDVQERFTDQLSDEQSFNFPSDVRDFANKLYEQKVDTLWVVLPQTISVNPDVNVSDNPRNAWERAIQEVTGLRVHEMGHPVGLNHSFGLPPLYQQDTVSVKYSRSAFVFDSEAIWITERGATQSGLSVSNYMQDLGYDHALVTGLNASECIADTVEDGLNLGLNITVVSDLLADARGWSHEPFAFDIDEYAAFHTKIVKRNMSDENAAKADFTLKSSVLKRLQSFSNAQKAKGITL